MAKPKDIEITLHMGKDSDTFVHINGEWFNKRNKEKASKMFAMILDQELQQRNKMVGNDEVEAEATVTTTSSVTETPKKKSTSSKKEDVDLSDILETTDTLYDTLLTKIESGEVTENGKPSYRLQVAKLLKENGVPITHDLLRDIDKHVKYAVRSGDIRGTLRNYTKNTIEQYKRSKDEKFDYNAAVERSRAERAARGEETLYHDVTPHRSSRQKEPEEDNRTYWETLSDQYRHEVTEIATDIQDVIGNVTSLFTGKRTTPRSATAQTVADSAFRSAYKRKLNRISPILPFLSGRLQPFGKSLSGSHASKIHPKTHKPDADEVLQTLGLHPASNPDHIPEYVHGEVSNMGSDSDVNLDQKALISVLREIENNTKASLSLLARVISPNSSIAKQSFPGVSGETLPDATQETTQEETFLDKLKSLFGIKSNKDLPQDMTNVSDRFSGLNNIIPGFFETQSEKLERQENLQRENLSENKEEADAGKPVKVEISNSEELGKVISDDINELKQTDIKERKLSELTDAEKERLENLGYKPSGIGYRKPSGKMATKENIFKTLESPRKLSELTDAEKETLLAKGFKPRGIGYSNPEGKMAKKVDIFKALEPDIEEGVGESILGGAAETAAETLGIERILGLTRMAPMLAAIVGTTMALRGGTHSYFGYGTDLSNNSKFKYAKGGVVNNLTPSVNMFADGGIVDKPTLFNHSGGQGLMGEAGAEAIMPLKRGSDGKLGVSAGEISKTKITEESLALKKATDMNNEITNQPAYSQNQPIVINDNKTINNGGGQSSMIIGGKTAGPRNSLDLFYFA